VFISHASGDREVTFAVRDRLRGLGHQVFVDQHPQDGFAVGEPWKQRLYAELRSAHAVVCLVSRAFVASDWCNFEIGVAEMVGARLLPIRLEGGAISRPLADLHWIEWAPDTAWWAPVVAVLQEIDAANPPPWEDGRSPFPGLAAFDDRMAPVFRGREEEVRRLLGRLRSLGDRAGGSLLLVTGPSGCGKSSLVRAGLAATIRGDPDWLVVPPFLPGSDPAGALTAALTAAGRRAGLPWAADQVRAALGSSDGAAALLDELLAAESGLHRRRRLLLVVDQAEELLAPAAGAGRAASVQTADPAQLAGFAAVLRRVLEGPTRVVLTIRSEFADQLLARAELAGIPASTFPLRPLRAGKLRAVIEEPARLAGLQISPALVDRLMADTGDSEALPLLAFTLQELAEGCTRGDALSVERYEELGGVRGALGRQADEVLTQAVAASGLPASEVLAALTRLAEVDGSGRRTRRRIDPVGLALPVRAALGVFVDRRLLSTSGDGGKPGRLGVTHEALLTAWPPLDAALTERAAALAAARSVEDGALDWQVSGRAEHHLWSGDRLRATELTLGLPLDCVDHAAATTAAGIDLSAAAARFLDACRVAAQAARARARARRRRVTAGLSVLLALALALAGFADAQRRTADRQRQVAAAHSLLAQAEATRANLAGLSLRLGVAAMQVAPSADTRSSLVTTLVGNHYAGTLTGPSPTGEMSALAFAPRRRLLATGRSDGLLLLWDYADRTHPLLLSASRHGGVVWAADFTADGRTLATGSPDGTVVLWDVADPTRPDRLATIPREGHTWVSSVAFSPEGRALLVGYWDNTVEHFDHVALWDVADRQQPRRRSTMFAGHTDRAGPIRAVAVSPEGRLAAAGADNGTVDLWDIADRDRPRRLAVLTGHLDSIWATRFSPDGRVLVTGSADQTAILWDVTRPRRPVRLSVLSGHTGTVRAVAVSPDGRTVATGSWDRTAILWDIGSAGTRARPVRLDTLGGHREPINAIAFSPDGRTLGTASQDGTSVLWDVRRTGAPIRQAHLTGSVGLSADAPTIAMSPAAPITVVGTGDNVTVWDSGDPLHPTRLATLGRPYYNQFRSVFTLTIDRRGDLLVTANGDGTASLWDLTLPSKPTLLSTLLAGDASGLGAVDISPDGRTLATGDNTGSAALWDITDPHMPHRLATLPGQRGPVRAVPFSPDGHTLVTGSTDNTAVIWDVTDRTKPRKRTSVTDSNSIYSGRFSPTTSTLALAEEGRKTTLWDLTRPAAPRRIVTLTSQASSVYAVGFSPDGQLLATGGYDKTVILWDLADPGHPHQLLTLPGGAHPVGAVVFSPDTRTLAVGAQDATLWDISQLTDITTHPDRTACAIVGTGLTPTEWVSYAPGLDYRPTCPD
jgi:WD40 repeat protein